MSARKLQQCILLASLIAATSGRVTKQHGSEHEHGGQRYVGVAVDAQLLQNDQQYSQIVKDYYEVLTPGNEMKWASIEQSPGSYNYEKADSIVKFAKENNMKVRGHALVWHRQYPGFLDNLGSEDDVRSAMNSHISSFMEHFAKDIFAIDVVNEAIDTEASDGIRNDKTPWMKQMGKSYITEAFKMARKYSQKVNPDLKLYINDYSIEGKNDKSHKLYEIVKELKEQNLIDGVGFQAHLIVGQVPDDMKENMERFAELGLDVAITELDIRMETGDQSKLQDLELQQSEDYAKVFRICDEVKTCVGVTIWGVTNKDSWVPQEFSGQGNALPFDNSYKPKDVVSKLSQWLSKK